MNTIALIIPTLDADLGAATGALAQLTAGCATRLLVVSGPPRGFTATVNDGLAQTTTEDVCILNDDVLWFTPGWLATLSAALYSATDIGLDGPTGKSNTVPMCKGAIGAAGLEDVAHLPFWCVLIRRAVLQQLGALDARYIHYASDNAYCDAAVAAGWRNVWVRAVYLAHQAHGSGKRSAWSQQDTALYRQERGRRR